MQLIVSYIDDIKTFLSLKYICKYTCMFTYKLECNSNRTFDDVYVKYLFLTSEPETIHHPESIIGLHVRDMLYFDRIPELTNLKYLTLYNNTNIEKYAFDHLYDINIFPTTLEYIETDCIITKDVNQNFDNLKILKLMYKFCMSKYMFDRSNENHFPQLTELYLENISLKNKQIDKYTTLKILSIKSFDFSYITCKILYKLRKLRVLILKLNYCLEFMKDYIEGSGCFSDLIEIYIFHFKNNNILRYMTDVKKTYLEEFVQYSNEDFLHLQNIRELHVPKLEKNSLNNVNIFRSLVCLRKLVCYDTIFGKNYDIDTMFLSSIKLRTLVLFNNTISDKALINATKLEKLYCRLNTFTDKVFEYIPNLIDLHLGNNEFITGDTFHLIPKVTKLNLSNAKNIIIERLQVFSDLTFLNVGNYSQFMDKHLQYFPKLTQLKLNAYDDIITDEGLKYVLHLKILNLKSNNLITDEGIRYLRKLTHLIIGCNTNITTKVLEDNPSLLILKYRKNDSILKEIINSKKQFTDTHYFKNLSHNYDKYFKIFRDSFNIKYNEYDDLCDDYDSDKK